jgi:hypothetical protein
MLPKKEKNNERYVKSLVFTIQDSNLKFLEIHLNINYEYLHCKKATLVRVYHVEQGLHLILIDILPLYLLDLLPTSNWDLIKQILWKK